MKKYATSIILQNVIMIGCVPIFASFGWGVSGIIISYVISSFGALIYLTVVCREYYNFSIEEYWITLKRLTIFGSQIVVTNIVGAVNYQADILITGFFLTATDLGYYAVSVGLSRFIWLVPEAVQKITYPLTSSLCADQSKDAIQVMIDKSMKYTAVIIIPITFACIIFSGDIILLIYGSNFSYSVVPFMILVIGTSIFGIAKCIGGSMAAAGRPDIGFKLGFLSAVLNVTLNLILIPIFGIVGAAIATTVTFILLTCVGQFFIQRILHYTLD
jgi:O-antigen/teichoic acid export membrane protein